MIIQLHYELLMFKTTIASHVNDVDLFSARVQQYANLIFIIYIILQDVIDLAKV